MDGCHEHGVTRARLIRKVTGVVAVPADALRDGASAYLAQGRTRREALVGGVGLAVGLAAAARLDPLALVQRAAAAEAAAGPQPILVSVFLDGGNDGLNTLVPRTASSDRATYEALRPLLGIADSHLLDVTGPDAALNLGWHPSAGGLKALHESGRLALFPATDYPNPDYSHFRSGHFWRTGLLDRSYSVQTGWLGRYLDAVGSETSPLQGVTIDWASDEVLVSRRAATAVVHAPEDFAVTSPDVRDPARLMAALERLGGPARTSAYRHAKAQNELTYRTWRALAPLATTEAAAPAIPYPDGSELGSGLRNLARLLGAGLGVRVASISQPGYDTHDGQDTRHPQLLSDLGGSLVAWQADLEARGLASRVLTLIWSEFGRRVADNASFGTDHGAGGLVMLLGPNLRAGIHADTWHLDQIDNLDGNIPVQTDFRDVYAGVLQEHLAIDATRILPGYNGTPVRVRA